CHAVGREIHHRDVARDVVHHVGGGAIARDGDAERVLAGVLAAGGRVVGVVQVDVAGGAGATSEAQFAGGVHVQLHQQVAAGGDDVGIAGAALGGEADRPRVGEEEPRLARLRHAGAQVQVDRPGVGLRPADAGDPVDIGVGVNIEA